MGGVARFQQPRCLASRRGGFAHRERRSRRPDWLRARLPPARRCAYPRAIAGALGRELHLDLLHPRRDGAAAPVRRHRHLEAHHRRRPHLLALAIDFRRAAGARAGIRGHGGARGLRGGLRGPAALSEGRPAPTRIDPVDRRRDGRAGRGAEGVRRHRSAGLRERRRCRAGSGRGAAAPAGDRRQFHRRLCPSRGLGHGDATGADRHGGGRHDHRCGVRRPPAHARRLGGLRLSHARRLLDAAHAAGRPGRGGAG